MHRHYDEEERDDELYHHGRKGQKWGQHIFSTVKNVATRDVANATPAVKKHNRNKRQDKMEKAKRTRIYDSSSGNYWHLKKELTKKQWLKVNKRKKAGEKTGDILKSMRVLKKEVALDE